MPWRSLCPTIAVFVSPEILDTKERRAVRKTVLLPGFSDTAIASSLPHCEPSQMAPPRPHRINLFCLGYKTVPTGFVKMKSKHAQPIFFEIVWELSPIWKNPCENLIVPKCLCGDIRKSREVGWKHASHTHIGKDRYNRRDI